MSQTQTDSRDDTAATFSEIMRQAAERRRAARDAAAAFAPPPPAPGEPGWDFAAAQAEFASRSAAGGAEPADGIQMPLGGVRSADEMRLVYMGRIVELVGQLPDQLLVFGAYNRACENAGFDFDDAAGDDEDGGRGLLLQRLFINELEIEIGKAQREAPGAEVPGEGSPAGESPAEGPSRLRRLLRRLAGAGRWVGATTLRALRASLRAIAAPFRLAARGLAWAARKAAAGWRRAMAGLRPTPEFPTVEMMVEGKWVSTGPGVLAQLWRHAKNGLKAAARFAVGAVQFALGAALFALAMCALAVAGAAYLAVGAVVFAFDAVFFLVRALWKAAVAVVRWAGRTTGRVFASLGAEGGAEAAEA
jgi:hypothetical protein